MLRTAISYFRPDGKYRGTMIVFVPDAAAGETLHPDGISVVRADGSAFRQENPYESKDRYTKEGLTAVPGEYSGVHRLREGVVEAVPENEKPVPAKSPVEQKIEALEAKVAALAGKEAALAAKPAAQGIDAENR